MSFSTRFGSTQQGLQNLIYDLQTYSHKFTLAAGGGQLAIPNSVINVTQLEGELADILSQFDQYYEVGHRLLIDRVLNFALLPYANNPFGEPIVGLEQNEDAQALDVDLNGPLDYVVNKDDANRLANLSWQNFTNLNGGQVEDLLYPFDKNTQAWRPKVSAFVIEAKRSFYTQADVLTYRGQMLAELVAFAYNCRNNVGPNGTLYVPGILTDGRWYQFYELRMPPEDGNNLRNCTYEVSQDLSIRDNLDRIVETIRQVFRYTSLWGFSKF